MESVSLERVDCITFEGSSFECVCDLSLLVEVAEPLSVLCIWKLNRRHSFQFLGCLCSHFGEQRAKTRLECLVPCTILIIPILDTLGRNPTNVVYNPRFGSDVDVEQIGQSWNLRVKLWANRLQFGEVKFSLSKCENRCFPPRLFISQLVSIVQYSCSYQRTKKKWRTAIPSNG